MKEQELFDRLIAIRDEASLNGRYKIEKMLNRLISDRWGSTARNQKFPIVQQTPINTQNKKAGN